MNSDGYRCCSNCGYVADSPQEQARDWAEEVLGLGVRRCPDRRSTAFAPGCAPLSRREKRLLHLRNRNLSCIHIGEIEGLSGGRVSQLVKRAETREQGWAKVYSIAHATTSGVQ